MSKKTTGIKQEFHNQAKDVRRHNTSPTNTLLTYATNFEDLKLFFSQYLGLLMTLCGYIALNYNKVRLIVKKKVDKD